jgi:putative spermidine/putrescine transport system ATP-binding protein
LHLNATALVKRFDEFVAVDHVGFSLEEGEFLSLLGPSGCGKTTTLRMIAGFAVPDEGRITLAGTDITTLPARARNIGMVFQNYALFPHMNVADNVGFGLAMRRIGRAEARRRIDHALGLVRMDAYGSSKPAQLSGGQQQRVALARALVIEPKLLLLDEPLSALDLKLREELREEISRITRELRITTVFVTHDQNEALVLSDKVAVMNKGRIEQLDTPENLYQRPATGFVARFLGGANVIEGDLVTHNGTPCVRIAPDVMLAVGVLDHNAELRERIAVSIRPEAIETATDGRARTLNGTVRRRRFLGSTLEYEIAVDGGHLLTVRWNASTKAEVGEALGLHVPPAAVIQLSREQGEVAQVRQ